MTEASGLWRLGEFRLLWLATAVSQLGTQVSELALPFIAIAILQASPFEVGLLLALEFLPLLLIGLPAGAWVDRLRRRPVMVAADVARGVALFSIPAAFAAGVLTLAQLYVVAFTMGALSVFFDTASQAYLPHLVGPEELQDANGALQVSEQGASVAGPALGGFLISLLSAPLAVIADAVSYLLSAACLGSIRREEPDSERSTSSAHGGTGMRSEIVQGLRYVLGHPYLRPLMLVSALTQFFGRIIMAVLLVYLVREVVLPAGLIGILLSLGSIGFLVGAAIGAPVARALGVGRTLVLGSLVVSVSPLCLALAPRPLVPVGVATWLFLYGLGALTWSVNSVSLRQAVTPAGLRGRVGATMRTATWGLIPIASVLGGALGTAVGPRPTIVIGALGALAASLPVVFSRMPALRELPRAA